MTADRGQQIRESRFHIQDPAGTQVSEIGLQALDLGPRLPTACSAPQTSGLHTTEWRDIVQGLEYMVAE